MLERKPGALAGMKPLAAWRQRGLWPGSYDRLLEQLIDRHGKQVAPPDDSGAEPDQAARPRAGAAAVEEAFHWVVRMPPRSCIWPPLRTWHTRAVRSSSRASYRASNVRCR